MADKKINISLGISADLNDFQKKIEKLQSEFDQVKFSDLSSEKISKIFDNIQSRLKKLQELTDKSPSLLGKTDYKQAEKEVGNLQTDISKLVREIQQLDTASKEGKLKILPKGEQERLEKLNEATKKYLKTLSQESKRLEDLEKKQNRLKQAQSALTQLEQTKKSAESKKPVDDRWLKGKNTQLAKLQETLAAQKQTEEAVQSIYKAQGLKGKKIGDTEVNINGTVTSLNKIREEAGKTATEIAEMEQKIQQYISKSDFNQLNQDIQTQKDLIAKLKEEIGNLQTDNSTTALKKLKTALEQAGISMEDIGDLTKKEDIEAWLSNLNTSTLEKFRNGLQGVEKATKEVQPELEKMGKSVRDSADDFDAAERAAQDLSTLKYQLMDFFSVTGAIQLFRRAIQSALETVKELDAAMTEIAVVSDFSVNDMWAQLPRFTEQANELGMAIKDTYAATTLYVQQGLDLDKSMKLATETLKMAAVAGMDAANATDAMTAALRGFNMELDETSAQRINDVYSELAAITASDTQEISTAMTKTASIAHSVNMEFETTAAFLAQGIETTREAAETIGTMLKTVIGRFSEVKSLYTEGQLTGQDEEGETIDVNKVQTALRAAGISMNEFLAGNEGLDQVFLRLSQRWNDLDILTQRYIATQAAGSRQQSRFIAIMQDYAKTTELVNAAYDSTGSGQRQFEKTLDSLAAKLTKLKNAWDQFTMGLANNEIIGAAVTLLTDLLTAINGIIDGISGGNGLIKSVITLGAAFAGLKAGGAIIDKILRTGFIQRKIDAFNGNISSSSTSTTTANSIVQTRSFIQNGKTSAKNWIQGWKSAGGVGGKKDFLVGSFSSSLNKVGQSFSVFSTNMEKDLLKQVYSSKDLSYSTTDNEILKSDFSKINSLSAQFKLGKINAEDFSNQLRIWGVSEQDAMKITEDYTNQIATQQEKMQSLSQTGIALGMSFTILGGVISSVIPGAEEFGKVLQTVGAALMGISMALPVVEKGITWLSGVLDVAPKTLNIYVAAFAAIVAAVVAIVSLIKKNSPEAQLEKASKATEKAKEMAEGASKAYDDLVNKKSEFDKLNSSLEGLTQGSLEWKKVLLEINNEILNLKSQFPDLEIAIDEVTGRMSVSNWGDILKKQQEYLQSAQDNLIMTTLEQAKGQLEIDNREIDKNKNLTEEQKKNQKAQKQVSYELSNAIQLKSLSDEKDNRAVSNFANLALQDNLYNKSDNSSYSILEKYKSEGRSELKEKYNTASKRKARYEQLFGIGTAEGKSKAEIKEALINQSVMEKYRNQTEKISKLSDNNQALVSAFSGDYTLRPEEMQKLLETPLSEYDKNSLAEALGITPQQIQGMMETARIEIFEGKKTLYKSFTDKNLDTDWLNGFGYSVIQSLGKQISEMASEEAKEYLGTLKDLSNDELTFMGTLDLSNMNNLIDGMEYLQSLGKSDEEIKSWWDTAIKGANTYIKSVEEASTVTDKLHAKLASADEVESRFTEGSASSEDAQAAMQAGVKLEGYLSRTANGWQLSEEKAKEASQAIKKNAAEQAQAVKESTEQQIESYKKLVGDNNTEVGILSSFDKDKGTYESGEITDVQTATKVANELGLAVQGEKETTEEFIARIQEAYGNIVSMLNNSSSILQTVTQEAAYASAVSMTAAEAYNSVSNEKGLSVEDKKTVEWAAQNEAVEAGADLSNLQAMQTYLQANNEALKENSEITAMVASQNAKMNLGLGEIMSSYEEWTGLIDESTGLIKVGSVEDAAAFNKLKASANKMLNTSVDLSSSFWDNAENITALKEAAEGSEKALGKLQKAAAIDYLQQIDLSGFSKETADLAKAEIQSFTDYLNSIELPKLEVGDTLDDKTFIQKFNDMASVANMSSQQIQEAVKAMGFSAKITYAEDTRKVPILTTRKTVTKRNLLLGATEWEEQTWQSGEKEVKGKFPVIETLTSSGSSGGGISVSNQNSGASNASKGSTGGSSSEKKESTWENPYDKLYNLTEEINEALRRREKLEKEYDRILERRGSTFRELRKNYNAQLQSLQKEIALQNQLRAGRLAQLNALSSETYKGQDSEGNELIKSFADWGVTKYGSYNPNTGLLKIDWDAIDDVKDENLGSAIEAYISRLEELQGQIENIDTQIEDFKDKVTELQKEGMQDYLDFEQKVYDAIVNQQQQLIDDYQDLSDKINDSNSKILDSIQRSIDLQRQIRDNTKTEEDINEKEARLAYLRQDTSNGNLLEIKQLEEELADDRQNYEDNLIDQQLERLTQQNDDAQTARERQIDLMQKQLDYASKNGDFWNQTYDLLTSAFTESGEINLASQVWDLLKKDEGWKGMSKFGQLNWQEEISKAILAASHGYANWNMYKAKEIDKNLVTSNGISLHYNGSNWVDSKGNIYNGVDYDSKIGGFTYSGMTKAPAPSGGGSSSSSGGSGAFSIGSRVKADPNAIIYADSYGGGGGSQYYRNDPIYTILDENNGYYLTRYHGVSGGYTGWFRKKDLTPYKTGGIADFTGPAWLDGTKSNPELILNARDTENFIALKDILSSIMDRKGLQNNTQSVGDMYFNIDINVDEISNDYDVENLSKKIKQELTDSAMYRNVNLVNFIR